MTKFSGNVTAFFTVLGIFFFLAFITALPVMLLWNYFLVGAIDGVHEIGFLQAWGISVLSNLMFKNSVRTMEK